MIQAMRVWCFVALLILCACSRKPGSNATAAPDTTAAETNPARNFISQDAPRLLSRTPDPDVNPKVLLSVWWTTVGEWLDTSDAYGFSLILSADGYLTHVQEIPLHRWKEFRRYYPNEEAERLFDSIMPSIEKHAIQTTNPPRNYYFIRFVYQTQDGIFAHDCILADLQPVTVLLDQVKVGGREEAPILHSTAQPWARKRFDIFPPPSLSEEDPASTLQAAEANLAK